MKKLSIIIACAVSFCAGYLLTGLIEEIQFNNKIELLNATIHDLENEGYSTQAAKKIALTELGFIPADAEYNALKED